MNPLIIFGILAGVFSAISYPPYIIAIFKGKAKPERASWLIWSVLTAMGFFTQLAVGATNSLWLPGIQGIGVIIVFLLSIRYGFGGLLKRDIATLVAAGLTLLIWYVTDNAILAVYLTVLIDGMGAWLTIIKSYEHPESETLITWALSGTGGFFGLLAVGAYNMPVLAYPFYIFLCNFAVVAAILLGRKKLAKLVV
ncbi:hypothetical protein A2348_04545 [Candidatus Uhrbacteria bacterium RIFOXYB12_FULL_58_10]|nr:MAG: hypothetical protein A2348_04545 [Candidatus Uhrbacteria bacterium RIFOXYB12_FULL_58_10]